ncbi:hypothetical protein L9F63_007317, partial [Diploptera punctata]
QHDFCLMSTNSCDVSGATRNFTNQFLNSDSKRLNFIEKNVMAGIMVVFYSNGDFWSTFI